MREMVVTQSPILIGRSEDCDLQLAEDRKVSRHHAEISSQAEEWFLQDLNSSNGTFLNDARVARSPLKNADRLLIGNTSLQFFLPDLRSPRLRWMPCQQDEADHEAIDIKEGRLSIGRDIQNDLSLPEARSLSRNHAVIGFEGGAWNIRDLNSRNGTFVNGEKIQRQRLRDGDEVRFSQERFRFKLQEGAPLQPIEEAKEAPRPQEEPMIRFISVSGQKTIGDAAPAQYRPGFLGMNHPVRRRMAFVVGAFACGFVLGVSWFCVVAGRFLHHLPVQQWADAFVPGLLGGSAGAILVALPDITKRVVLDPYFRFRAWLLRSAAHRRMRRVQVTLSERLETDPQDWGALSDMIGLHLLKGDMHEATRIVESCAGAEHQCSPLFNNLGVAFVRSHSPSRAVEAIASALSLSPDQGLYHANLGRAHLKMDEGTRAIESLEKATSLEPDNKTALVSLGVAFLRARRLEEAEKRFRAALNLDLSSTDATNNLGVIHHLNRNSESSKRLLKAVLRAAPGYAVAHANLGIEHLFNGESSEAIRELTKGRQLSHGLFAIRNNLSIAHYLSHSAMEAERELNAVAETSPVPAEVLYNLGTLHWLEGRYDAAADCLTRAVQRNPGDAASRINLGCALFQSGNIRRAAQMFESALEHAPGNPAALTDLGLCLILLGRMNEAVPYIKKAAALLPDQTVIRFNLAYAEHLFGNAEAAVQAYEQLVGGEDDPPEVYANVGLCHYFLGGNLKLSISFFTRALELRPDLHTVPLSLGRIYCEVGELALAQRYLEMAVKDEPVNPDVYRNLGLVYYQTDQADRAVPTFMRAVQLSPHEAPDHNNLALAYAKKKKHEEAIYHFKRALEFKPDDVAARSNLGLSYYLVGKVEEALTQWGEVSRLSPKYAAEREAVQYAEFDEARLGYRPLDWQARSVYIPPVCMGFRYHLLPFDDNELGEVHLTESDLNVSAALLRRARRYEEAHRVLYV